MSSQNLSFGPFLLDRERRRLLRDGQPVPVNHRGYALLEALLEAGGEPVTKEALMDWAWSGAIVEEGNLNVQISTLRRSLGEGADALIVTVPRVGYRLVTQANWEQPHRRGRPLIAVLPFDNHGNAAEDGYFADGIVEDLITALSRFRAFSVVSRGTSFALRDRGIANARAATEELGLRYALEGSVRRMGNLLRVTAQLVEAETGAHLWAERYDGVLADVFTFQDHITESVVGVVDPEIRKAEIERARRKPTASLNAYDLYLRALPLLNDPATAGHPEAISLLHRSAQLDPGFALPLAYLAWIYEKRISLRDPLGQNDRGDAIENAHRALAIGGDDPVVRAICGWVLYRVADDYAGVEALRKAVEESPNNVIVLQLAIAIFTLLGHAEEALDYSLRAYRLSPGAPEAYILLYSIGSAELLRGNNEAAIEWCLRSLATFNDWMFTHITLVAAYGNLDRMEEAQTALKRVRELNPNLTMKIIEDNVAKIDAYADAVIPGLRKAGLPER
ncbi:MAG: winged helix-turn-helix domain-containing protein [Alphaproteobacteria bacterium]|nr:winged helix-turn-helix domain-containing protein [Alphaproteobacteria bacterium]MBU1561652.1 winged helix-turn-helix domain-containing protein [Alphaproteobacteria bacterium]MBU2302367.1 winged helix-turn-helix domain-containing protein [Alphaproteobacteria bacterium]MBU2368647.1 winged helix-turn-helix domain-containing protein [Alphaproteobacteria bacterium]